MNLRDMRRVVRVAIQDADLVGAILGEHDSMLSPAERAALYQLIRMVAPSDARIAELGTYLGGTTRLFGEADRLNLALERSIPTTTGVLIAQYRAEYAAR